LKIEKAKMIDASFNMMAEYCPSWDKWKQLNYPMKEWEKDLMLKLIAQK